MSQFSVYFDEDAMDTDLVKALLSRCAVVTPVEENFIGATDEQQFLNASQRGCVLYTFNVSDFHAMHTRLLATAQHHGGLILVPQQRFSVGEQLRRILRLRAVKSAEAMRDCAEFLSRWG